jgi:hypothetical protein
MTSYQCSGGIRYHNTLKRFGASCNGLVSMLGAFIRITKALLPLEHRVMASYNCSGLYNVLKHRVMALYQCSWAYILITIEALKRFGASCNDLITMFGGHIHIYVISSQTIFKMSQIIYIKIPSGCKH